MLTPHGWLEVKEQRGERDFCRVAMLLRQCYPQEAWTALDVQSFVEREGNVVKTLALGDDGLVIGSMLYRVKPDVVQIARVAVHERFRRCRAAIFAVRCLAGPTSPVRRKLYEARVHELNAAGIGLMRACGFAAESVAPGHYRDGHDAYVFRLFKEAPNRPQASVATVGQH